MDNKYFRIVDCAYSGRTQYSIFQCIYESICLYSSDGEILAIVSLKCDNPQCKVYIAPRVAGAPANFQGILTENHREIQFVITNPTKHNYVKIDVMKRNEAVSEIDPGPRCGAINQINELKSRESYCVQTDQASGRTMILSSLQCSANEYVTVERSEKSTEQMGTYYYFAVTPQDNGDTEFISKFDNTIWVKNDLVFIEADGMPFPRPTQTLELMGLRPKQYGGDCHSSVASPSSSLEFLGIRPKCADLTETSSINTNESQQDEQCTSTEILESDVMQSYATNITPGRAIPCPVGISGVTYKYDVSSNITGKLCCVSFSICTTLKQRPVEPYEQFRIRLENYLRQYIEKKNALYISALTTVYTQEECVICLEKGIDTVLYDCGHSCCHNACIDGVNMVTCCPLCRRYIKAILKK